MYYNVLQCAVYCNGDMYYNVLQCDVYCNAIMGICITMGCVLQCAVYCNGDMYYNVLQCDVYCNAIMGICITMGCVLQWTVYCNGDMYYNVLQCAVYCIRAVCIKWGYVLQCIFGASLSERHTYCTAVQNPPDIYIYMYRPSVVQFGPVKGPINAQRANVRPASNGSKVNNITLKTATLILRFN